MPKKTFSDSFGIWVSYEVPIQDVALRPAPTAARIEVSALRLSPTLFAPQP